VILSLVTNVTQGNCLKNVAITVAKQRKMIVASPFNTMNEM
jgi:hypothetical protein